MSDVDDDHVSVEVPYVHLIDIYIQMNMANRDITPDRNACGKNCWKCEEITKCSFLMDGSGRTVVVVNLLPHKTKPWITL